MPISSQKPTDPHLSLWMGTSPHTSYPELQTDLPIEVAIIGGGLAGLNAAYFLKQAGIKVAVLEATRVGTHTSGNTTANITVFHDIKYHFLLEQFGREGGEIYAHSHQWAIEMFASLIEKEHIQCHFHRLPACFYTRTDEMLEAIQKEAQATKKLGMPTTYLTSHPELPFPIKGALQLEQQACFHPRSFLLSLARSIPGNGSHLFENTRVIDLQAGELHVLTTEHGQRVKAKRVIMATNFPIFDKGGFFARLVQSRSYALAAQLETPLPRGIFLGEDEGGHTLRPHTDNHHTWLIIGGETHLAGESETEQHYQKLEAWARRTFPISAIPYVWSAQDSTSTDRVPLIGNVPFSDSIYVTTGFGEWGMTTSIVSAKLLTDLITGKPNDWASLYSPSRFKPLTTAGETMALGIRSVKGLMQQLKPVEEASSIELANGEGTIAASGNQKVAISRDKQGKLHRISATCTHMGCIVAWNTAEQSWDCPCHGSRFTPDGTVINGPARRPLPQLSSET